MKTVLRQEEINVAKTIEIRWRCRGRKEAHKCDKLGKTEGF